MRQVLIGVLLITPWIVLTEFLFIVSVWITDRHVVPETATYFHSTAWRWETCIEPVWLVRSVPVLLLGLVFFRHVLSLGRWISVVCATLLVPVAINLSILWSMLFMWYLRSR